MIDYFSEIKDYTFINNRLRKVFDYSYSEPEELKECQDAYKTKVCFNYSNNNCLKNNLNVLDDVKVCYSKHLNNILVQHYGKSNNDAEIFAQNLWDIIYKRFSFIYGKHEYMLKESELTQKISATILTLLYLHDYLHDMVDLTKGHKFI